MCHFRPVPKGYLSHHAYIKPWTIRTLTLFQKIISGQYQIRVVHMDTNAYHPFKEVLEGQDAINALKLVMDIKPDTYGRYKKSKHYCKNEKQRLPEEIKEWDCYNIYDEDLCEIRYYIGLKKIL